MFGPPNVTKLLIGYFNGQYSIMYLEITDPWLIPIMLKLPSFKYGSLWILSQTISPCILILKITENNGGFFCPIW